jgi:hypothetical protein
MPIQFPPDGLSYWSVEYLKGDGAVRRYGVVAYTLDAALAQVRSDWPGAQVINFRWLGVVDVVVPAAPVA